MVVVNKTKYYSKKTSWKYFCPAVCLLKIRNYDFISLPMLWPILLFDLRKEKTRRYDATTGYQCSDLFFYLTTKKRKDTTIRRDDDRIQKKKKKEEERANCQNTINQPSDEQTAWMKKKTLFHIHTSLKIYYNLFTIEFKGWKLSYKVRRVDNWHFG